MSTILGAFEAGATRKGYAVEYLDMAGDLVTGILLNQIIFWITERQYDRAIKKLVERDLITHRRYKFNGTPTCHIQLKIGVVTAVLQRIVSDSTKMQNPFHKNAERGFGGAGAREIFKKERHSTRAVVYRRVSESHRSRRHVA